MQPVDVGTTNPAQLSSLSDWQNSTAWVDFRERYDPLLRYCCACCRLDHDAANEVCQETWIEVAKRMRSFVYDPKGTFRGWLWKVCQHKAMDYVERRKRERAFSLDERDEPIGPLEPSMGQEGFEEPPASSPAVDPPESTSVALLFQQAEQIQTAVRQRVEPRTWEAFWLVGVMLWSVDDAARALQMSHAAVSKAKARVAKKLQAAGRR